MKTAIELNNSELNTTNRTEYNNGYCTKALRDKMRDAVDAAEERIRNGETAAAVVSISYGNKKMGAVPSVSLLPYITCPAACKGTCDGKCYAGKLCSIYKQVMAAYAKNLAIYRVNKKTYFDQISMVSGLHRFFRWHVSGDIVDRDYFSGMVRVALENPGTKYLAFTKRYKVVNDYIAANGPLPENLKILFSGWDNLKPENPYNLPETTVFGTAAKKQPDPSWNICGGNCSECICRGCGCWKAEKGETIAFHIH